VASGYYIFLVYMGLDFVPTSFTYASVFVCVLLCLVELFIFI